MNRQLEIELIIFDMDGLMFDTEKISFETWREAASLYNYQISKEIFEKTIGTNINKAKEIFIEQFGERFPFDLVRNERTKLTEEIVKTKGVPIKKGLLELIDYLNLKNVKMAVATSTSKSRALNLLSSVQIDNFFDCILCGDEIENSKPNPEIFLKVAERLNCVPSKCLVLEDSELGVVAANKAGMIPIMIPDFKEPSDEIQRLIFRRLNNLLETKVFLEEIMTE